MCLPGEKACWVGLVWVLIAACGGGGGGNSDTNGGKNAEVPGETDTVASVDAMGKGDIVLITFSGGQASLSFSSAPSDSTYDLIIQSTAQSGGTSTLSLGNIAELSTGLAKSLDSDDPDGDVLGPQEYLEATLRAAETTLAVDELPVATSVGKSLSSAAVSVGSSGTFRVLSSLSSVSSYNTVTATAKCVNNRIALFADADIDSNLSGVMASTDYATLCSQFKTSLDTLFSILGEPPDINSDESVTVLMTPKVNALGSSGGGIVTGFFFAGDLLTKSNSNPASNEREIVFVVTPDPNGVYGTALTKAFTMENLLTAVVPHEVQHLLSYYHHVLVNNGASEGTWLNEALSHLMEDIVGYGQENPSRVALYLQSTATSPLIPSASPDLSERGGLYLFLRFLYEQSSNGNAFLKALVQTDKTGVTNLESAFGSGNANLDEFADFMRRWGIAVTATNADVTTDARYIYKSRTKNGTTGHWHGVCLVCDAEDGRGTTLAGPTKSTYGGGTSSLRGSSSAYFQITSVPNSISLSGSSSAALQGILLRTK